MSGYSKLNIKSLILLPVLVIVLLPVLVIMKGPST